MKHEPPLTMSASQIAKFVGVGRLTAMRMLYDGRINARKVPKSRQWEVAYKELEKAKDKVWWNMQR